MASSAGSILSQLKTILAAITTGGGYNNDLDAAGQVILGKVDRPPVGNVACVEIWPEALVGESLDIGATEWKQNLTVRIRGWAPGADGTSEQRVLAASDLMSDIHKALRADLTLGGTALDSDVEEIAAFEGEDNDGIRWGACLLDCTAMFTTTTGAT